MTGRAYVLATLSVLVGCPQPPADPAAVDDGATLSGAVIAQGATGDGAVMVFLSDAANPMPPLGTGAPLDVAVVPALSGATPTGHYAFTGLAPGDYIVTALYDADHNFHPLTDALAGASCGDLVGGHLADTTTGAPAVVSVGSGELREDVTVLIGRSIPFSRPSFAFGGLAAGVVPGTTDLSVVAAPVSAAWETGLALEIGPWDPANPADTCAAAFRVIVRDLDGDGVPDAHPDHPGRGFLDVWPRAYLRYLGPPADTDGDGTPDGFTPTSETWVSEAFPHALALAATPPEQIVARLNLPVPETSLGLLWPDAAIRTTEAGDEIVTDRSLIPAGAWALTLVSVTGQTWTVPNVLGGGDARSPATAIASQRGPVWRP